MKNKTMLSTRIQELRKARGVTQKQLATLTGLSYNSIIDYENGRSEPNSKAMAALEEFFNVSGAYLRGETQDPVDILQWKNDGGLTDYLKNNLSSFLAEIQTRMQFLPDRELKFADDILMLFHSYLREDDKKKQTLKLCFAGLSMAISESFIDWYNYSWQDLPQDERIKTMKKMALESYKEILDDISEQLQKNDI